MALDRPKYGPLRLLPAIPAPEGSLRICLIPPELPSDQIPPDIAALPERARRARYLSDVGAGEIPIKGVASEHQCLLLGTGANGITAAHNFQELARQAGALVLAAAPEGTVRCYGDPHSGWIGYLFWKLGETGFVTRKTDYLWIENAFAASVECLKRFIPVAEKEKPSQSDEPAAQNGVKQDRMADERGARTDTNAAKERMSNPTEHQTSSLPADLARALGEAIKKGSEGAAARGQAVRQTVRSLTGVDLRTDTEAMDYLAAQYGWEFARDYKHLPDAQIMDFLEAAAHRLAAMREHQHTGAERMPADPSAGQEDSKLNLPGPIHRLLKAMDEVMAFGFEIYRWRGRPSLPEVKKLDGQKAELLQYLRTAATESLLTAHKAGINYDSADGRIGNLVCSANEWLSWAWRYRGKAPKPVTDEAELEKEETLKRLTRERNEDKEKKRIKLEREIAHAKDHVVRMGLTIASSTEADSTNRGKLETELPGELAAKEYQALLLEWQQAMAKLGNWKETKVKQREFFKLIQRFWEARAAIVRQNGASYSDFPDPAEIKDCFKSISPVLDRLIETSAGGDPITHFRQASYWLCKIEDLDLCKPIPDRAIDAYLAARHNLTEKQIGGMTWGEIAQILKRDYETSKAKTSPGESGEAGKARIEAPPADPPGDPLTFVPGAIVYRGQREPLTGKPWQVLKALAEAPDCTLSLRDLLGKVWENTVIGEEAVRRHVYSARKALRKAMRAAHVTPPDDPIHAVDRGTNRTAWHLDLP